MTAPTSTDGGAPAPADEKAAQLEATSGIILAKHRQRARMAASVARLAAENARLRTRVGELEALVLRLSEENDALAGQAAALLDLETASISQMQPA